MSVASKNPDGIEAGYTTTEFWLTVITAFLGAVMDLYVAFGGILKPEQRGAVIGIISASIPLLVAAYAVARSIRKKGVVTSPSQTNSPHL